jgi:Protein of unknown function (DUF4231)
MVKAGSPGTKVGAEGALLDWLEGQIDWYDRKASKCQRAYKWAKATIILLALAVPVLAEYGEIPGFHDSRALLVAIAAGGILLLEGLQQINKWQENWILYRSTCEGLRAEERLFFHKAGPYDNLKPQDALKVLAERTGSLVTAEHTRWIEARHQKGEMTMG